MIPKSIKWRLQLWYGLILVVVLAGFGITAYQMERSRQFLKIDDELHQRVEVLKSALRRQQPRGQNANRPFLGQPPRRQNMGERPLDGPPPGQFPEDEPQGQNARPPLKFSLPQEAAHFFEAGDPHEFYFSIHTRDGKEIAGSTNQPQRTYSYVTSTYAGGPANIVQIIGGQIDQAKGLSVIINPTPPKVSSFAHYRGIFESLPSGESIAVGCSVLPELQELHRTALNLTAVGGLILLVGLAGGWWLVSRSLKPISSISATAVKIAAGDLSQRINVAEAESELGQLVAVLNSTFARLETAFAQQKQFASDAAHELRTPVTVILTQTQTALNRERDAASYKQTVEACQRAAQRMRKLIESLLALARFDAGQEVLKRLRFNLARTVSECAEHVQPLADERGVKIAVEVEPLEITGDPERLAQVITNLLTNAIQYNHPDGQVRVNLESQNGLAVLRVVDTGQGITAEDLPRVFGRFYRGDSSRTGAGNAGLGLAIAKAIIEAHGGTLEVASMENVGTTFTVRLPA